MSCNMRMDRVVHTLLRKGRNDDVLTRIIGTSTATGMMSSCTHNMNVHSHTRIRKQAINTSTSCLPNRAGRNSGGGGGGGGGGKSQLKPSSRAWLNRQSKDVYVKKAKSDNSPSRALYKLEEIGKQIRMNPKLKKLALDKKGFFHSKKNKNIVMIDLGAAPGGWSLYASKNIGDNGTLIAVDLLPLESNTTKSIESYCKNNKKLSSSFHFIQGDFTNASIKEDILDCIPKNHNYNEDNYSTSSCQLVDCIISDMAANFTGDQLTDALRTMNLCEDAMMFAAGENCFDESNDNKEYNASIGSGGLLRHGGSLLCKYFACGKDNERDLMTAAQTRFQYNSILKPPASRKESSELYLFATGFKG